MFSANTTQVNDQQGPSELWIFNTANTQGQQGIGTYATQGSTTPIKYSIYGVDKTSGPINTYGINETYGFVIKQDGSLWGTGSGTYGQIGNGYSLDQTYFVFVDNGPWDSVSIGYRSTYAVKTDNTLWVWGNNSSGQLGIGSVIAKSSPTQVGSSSNWSKVVGGYSYALAVKTDGTLWAWGVGTGGVLGNNSVVNQSSPIQIGSDTNWADIGVCGTSSSFAIKTDGTLWSWGLNPSGQLGHGNIIPRSSPVQVGSLTDWASVTGASATTYAVKTNGSLWAWGSNGNGEIGDSSIVSKSSPVQIVSSGVSLASGLNASAGMYVDNSGGLWTWGLNVAAGNLLDATTVSRSSPVQIGTGYASQAPLRTSWIVGKAGLGLAFLLAKQDSTMDYVELLAGSGETLFNQASQLSLGDTSPVWSSGKTAVVAGATNSCLAIKDDGSLWGWGYNNYGQIGDGTKINRSSRVQIGALTNWMQVAGGFYYAAAIKTDGTLWAWGKNVGGPLGTGNVINRSSPVQVGSLTDWAQVSCSSSRYDFGEATLAVKTNGTLWAWGTNINGQLGTTSTISRSSPVQVGSLTDWMQVSTNGDDSSGSNAYGFTLAVKTDGTLWSWGSNLDGKLGLNIDPAISKSSPTQIGTGTNWSKVSAGGRGGLAIKTDGTLWAWGYGENGANGNTSNLSRSSPVQVGTATDWIDCARGMNQSIAIRSDGSIWGFGYLLQLYRIVPQAPVDGYSSPVQLSNGSTTAGTGWNSVSINGISANGFFSVMATKA